VPNSLTIPRNPESEGARLTDVVEGILEHDQLDDWLPDPVYYEDHRIARDRTAGRLEAVWKRGQIELPECEDITLPRSGGDTLAALAIPFDARAVTHRVVAAFAARADKLLIRDKVRGFWCKPKQVPLFAQPSEDLGDTYGDAMIAAMIMKKYVCRTPDQCLLPDYYFEIRDVVRFNRTARPEKLLGTLGTASVRPDETGFLAPFLQRGTPGLPSIDDAFAYVYNFYLAAADQSLAAAKSNFFRYRDEYFLIDRAGVGPLDKGLASLGMRAVVAAGQVSGPAGAIGKKTFAALSEMKDDFRKEKMLTVPLGPLGGGRLTAYVTCRGDVQTDGRCTDGLDYKITYVEGGQNVAGLFRGAADASRLDAIDVLPYLRIVHSSRRAAVFQQNPATLVDAKYRSYRGQLRRDWLRSLVTSATTAAPSWHITWAARALSDLSPLTAEETGALQAAARNEKLPPYARIEAQVALARGSTLAPDAFWRMDMKAASTYRRRSALLGAAYLAARGHAAAWTSAAQAFAGEAALIDLLKGYAKK